MEPMAMVGRAGELGELNRAWSRLRTARSGPSVAVITGPPGIGKSRLVTAATDGFAPTPAAIHLGSARVHSPAPYDWLAAVLSQRPTRDEQLEISVRADALAWLRQDLDVPRERYAPDALLRIAVRVVRALVGDGPAVLIVEDLHALDPASLNLIAALAATALPALLLITARLPEAGTTGGSEAGMLPEVLARLAGAPGAIRQHLAALDRKAVATALAGCYGAQPAAVVDAVWQRTGGNPARLSELLATHSSPAELALAEAPLSESGDLTARERDVLACIADGLSNQQVASRLGISVRTVTVHVSNLLRKTRSRSRTDAAVWAVRHGATYSSVTTTSS